MLRSTIIGSLFLVLPCFGQVASAPGEPVVPPGIAPDERIDLTGDLIADLVITGRTDLLRDDELGVGGWYRRTVRTLPGTSILLRSTRNNAGYFTLEEDSPLDTTALLNGFHYKQLMWSAPEAGIEFRILQQPFGEGVTPAMAGWYGTGEYHDGTMVLRSTMGSHTTVAAFDIRFNLPAGRIWITAKEVMTVSARFGSEGDPPPDPPLLEDPYSFGHEREPQIIIPPGLPPDELVDLNNDEVPDAIITGHEEYGHCTGRCGYHVRGISPAPGKAFLKRRNTDGTWSFFQLAQAEQLTPDRLSMGLENGSLSWAYPEKVPVFRSVLRHPFGMPDEPQEWTQVEDDPIGDLVYRTISYGQPIIGVVEISWAVPGGALGLNPQAWVPEGEVLEVR